MIYYYFSVYHVGSQAICHIVPGAGGIGEKNRLGMTLFVCLFWNIVRFYFDLVEIFVSELFSFGFSLVIWYSVQILSCTVHFFKYFHFYHCCHFFLDESFLFLPIINQL